MKILFLNLILDGPGIMDPCEKDKRDVLSDLTGQQREDITSSAQHALRLIAFNQIYKILGIERLPDARTSSGFLNDRKRPRDPSDQDDGEVIG